MRFLNHQDLARALIRHRRKLPNQIDLVVGVPRSGMIAATMLATQMNLPLVDADGFLEGRVFRHGSTKRPPDLALARSRERVVLVLDDVIGSGRAIRELRAEIAARGISGKIVFCAVFGTVSDHPDVDMVLQPVDETPCFPWNLMHHAVLADSCVDIDGVLCANPQGHESFEGRAYDQFLKNAISLHRTSGKIGWLVTSRLEKHRAATIEWLARHQVDYKHLIMASQEDKADSPAYKARIYRETGAAMFIESEAADAEAIASLSQRPVICIETLEMIYPSDPAAIRQWRKAQRTGWRRRKSAIKVRLRGAMGDRVYYAAKGLYRKWIRPKASMKSRAGR